MRILLKFAGLVMLAFCSIFGVIFIHSRLARASSETFYTNTFIIGLAMSVYGILMVANGLRQMRKRRSSYFPWPQTQTARDFVVTPTAVVVLTVGLLLLVAYAILYTIL